jgi:hypothetical protein
VSKGRGKEKEQTHKAAVRLLLHVRGVANLQHDAKGEEVFRCARRSRELLLEEGVNLLGLLELVSQRLLLLNLWIGRRGLLLRRLPGKELSVMGICGQDSDEQFSKEPGSRTIRSGHRVDLGASPRAAGRRKLAVDCGAALVRTAVAISNLAADGESLHTATETALRATRDAR